MILIPKTFRHFSFKNNQFLNKQTFSRQKRFVQIQQISVPRNKRFKIFSAKNLFISSVLFAIPTFFLTQLYPRESKYHFDLLKSKVQSKIDRKTEQSSLRKFFLLFSSLVVNRSEPFCRYLVNRKIFRQCLDSLKSDYEQVDIKLKPLKNLNFEIFLKENEYFDQLQIPNNDIESVKISFLEHRHQDDENMTIITIKRDIDKNGDFANFAVKAPKNVWENSNILKIELILEENCKNFPNILNNDIKFFKKSFVEIKSTSIFNNKIAILNFLMTAANSDLFRGALLKNKEDLNVEIQKINDLILTEIPEISIYASQILSGFIKDPRFGPYLLKNDCLNCLLRQSLARHQLVAGNSIYPIAALVQSVGIEKMDLNQKQKDLIFRALLQVSTQLISLGNYPHALVALEDSLKIDKDNINSLAMIVTVHNKIGNVEQENKYLRKLIKIVPFAAEFRLGLASNLFRKGSESSLEDREEAIKHLQKGIDAGNASSPEQLVFLLSDILLSLDREQEAIYYLSDFCESQRGAKIAKAQYKLAKTLLSRFPNDSKALEKVRFLLTKISETEKFSLQTQRNLASVLIKLGHYEEAENICRKMLILDSQDESVLELMSLIKRKRSDWKGVEAILLQLAKNKTLSPAQQFSLGVSRERQNKNVSVVFECYLNGLRELRRRCGRGTAKEEKWFKENPADLKILKDLSERCFSGGCSKEILNEIDSFQKWVKSA